MLCCLIVPFAAVKFASAAGIGTKAAIKLSEVVGPPTSFTKVTGANFGASETVKLYFDTKVDGSTTTTSTGTFSFTIKIPRMATPGTHTIKATGQTSKLSATAPFLVRTDWSQAGFDAAQTRYNPYENVISASNASQLTNAWTNNYTAPIYSTPIVAGGRVFISADKLYALDATTGATLWSSSYTPFGSPVVDAGIVYVASIQLYALKASTGALLWSDPLAGNGVLSSPTVANGVVYIDSFNGPLYAFNARTGKQLWANTGCNCTVTPAVANGLLYIGSGNVLYALNDKTGATQWTYTTTNFINTSAAVANGLVYVSDGKGVLYALNALTGTFGWSETTDGFSEGIPAVAGNTVFVTGTGLFAFNAKTGTPLWSAYTNELIRISESVANGVVYVILTEGPVGIAAVDANTGKSLWGSSLTSDQFTGAPAIANGMVYIGVGSSGLGNQGTMYAFHLKS